MGNVQARKVWKYEIVDFSKIPDEYKEINSGKVREALRDKKEIPGVRFYQDEVAAVI